tara:strand:+ start:59 stop:466 length:408 start_codon:yes stop_codon:yes gene_type:complete
MPVIISDEEFTAMKVALATMNGIFDTPVATPVEPKVAPKKKVPAKAAKTTRKTTKVVAVTDAIWASKAARGSKAYSEANKAANKVVNTCIKNLRSEETRAAAGVLLAEIMASRVAAGAKAFPVSYQARIAAALAA